MRTKQLLPVILFFCSICCMQAAPIDTNTAKKVALTFMQSRSGCSGISAKDIHLAFTSAQLNEDAANSFYAFNAGEHAFIIVSADDKAAPILAYSTTSALSRQQLSPAVSEVLKGYHKGIRECISEQKVSAVQDQWDLLISGEPLVRTAAAASAGPLLKTEWGQSAKYSGWGDLYNKFCPYDSNTRTHAVTGCVATAMAQVVAYWGWPVNGYGQCAYTDKKYGYLVADYSHADYDYKHMPVALDNQSSVEEVDAVAQLMHDCGVGAGMGYGTSGSGAATLEKDGGEYSAEYVLRNYFGFVNGEGLEKKNYLNAWLQKAKTCLDKGIPIIYRGSDPKRGGHCFVCDGYDDNGMFHFNWGWDGSYNGYYLIDSANGGGYVFKIGQSGIFNMMPPTRLNAHHIVLFSNITASADTITCDENFTASVRVQNNGNKPFFGEFRLILENSQTHAIVAVFDTLSFLQDSLPGETAPDAMTFHGKLKSLMTGNYNFRLQYRDTNAETWNAVPEIGNFTNVKNIRFDGGTTSTRLDTIRDITACSAEVLGDLENACSETVIMKAIQYKKSSASSFSTVKDTSSGKTIHAFLDKLESGTSYDVQTYVMVQADATYKTYTSEKTTFTTLSSDQVAGIMEDGIRIWPNPSKGEVHIEATEMPDGRVRVINPLGQKIMETLLEEGQTELQLGNMPKGFYFISLENAGQKTIRKIVLE